MLDKVISRKGVPIRLTDERWAHITEEHCELAGLRLERLETIANPSRILAGYKDELLAVREMDPGKHLVVVYRKMASDGFIVTAFLATRRKSLDRKEQVWPK